MFAYFLCDNRGNKTSRTRQHESFDLRCFTSEELLLRQATEKKEQLIFTDYNKNLEIMAACIKDVSGNPHFLRSDF